MRKEFNVLSTLIILGSALINVIDARAVWDEVNMDDFDWEVVDLDNPKIVNNGYKDVIEIECYSKLPAQSGEHTFKLNLKTKERLACIIELPGSINIQFDKIELRRPNAFARILTGNNHDKPSVASAKLASNTPFNNLFTVDCNYGFLIVRHDEPMDSVVFTVSDRVFSPDSEYYVSEDECMGNLM